MNKIQTSDLVIKSIKIKPVDIGLTDAFTISQGSVETAENAFIEISLQSGIKGYGEIAPFEELSGENRDFCVKTAEKLKDHLTGKPVSNFIRLSRIIKEAAPDQPAPLCGYEMAILDAFSRSLGISFWELFGGRRIEGLQTDITIPILEYQRSLELAEEWHKKGFNTLKIKVGSDFDREVKLVQHINDIIPGIRFIIDANQGFEVDEAILFIRELEKKKCDVILFEQPVHKNDIEGMKKIKNTIEVPLAADETVFTVQDALEVIKNEAADVINLKIMKSGIIDTLEIASLTLSAGLKLMIGGMVESRLAMGCSLAVAQVVDGITFFDLDTPILMSEDPLAGGYAYDGPLMIPNDEPGLGITPKVFQ
ncbi:MAG: dipeptide epimerase [Bacteroidales bacterium]|nr:dipeptide epimerase [Bacteroidales bacterium]